jgi:hypothetical protein
MIMPQTADERAQTPDNFSILFLKMKEIELREVMTATEEMARTAETVRLLSEAISEMERPTFTTYATD